MFTYDGRRIQSLGPGSNNEICGRAWHWPRNSFELGRLLPIANTLCTPSMRGLYATRLLLAQRTLQRRPMSTDVNRLPKKMEGPGEDFRPPWVYIGSRLISFLVIPSTFTTLL